MLQVILGFEYAFLNEIEAISGFTASVKDISGRVGFADEVRYCAAPERFGLRGYGRECLEDELNGLLISLPLEDGHGGLVLVQCCGRYLAQVVLAWGAEHNFARKGWGSFGNICLIVSIVTVQYLRPQAIYLGMTALILFLLDIVAVDRRLLAARFRNIPVPSSVSRNRAHHLPH